jgi:hypothetical protein
VEKARGGEVKRSCGAHKCEGGDGLGLKPKLTEPLYSPRLVAGLGQAAWALKAWAGFCSQARSACCGSTLWAGARKAWANLSLLFLVIFFSFLFLVDQIKF